MGVRLAALKGARWLLWLVLVWILVRGIASIILPPPEAAPPAPAPAAVKPADLESPGAFAALFAREYLTVQTGKESERAARLQPLLVRSLDSQAGLAAGTARTADQVAESTWPFRVEQQSETRYLVTVAARVTTATEKGPATRNLYLAVPVLRGPEGYAVYDYPGVVPGPAPAALNEPLLAGEEFSDPTGEINTLLVNFFKAYASGGQAEVGYYLEPGLKLRGLEGAAQFTDLQGVSLRKQGSETWAAALVGLADPVSGYQMRQRYTVQLVQRDGRWYIKQILQKGV